MTAGTQRCATWVAVLLMLLAIAFPNLIVGGGEGPQCVPNWPDLNYVGGPASDVAHLLDIYLPTEGTGRFPVVIYIHGSAWTSSNSKGAGQGVAQILCPGGFATVAINHRGTVIEGTQSPSGDIFPAQIHDVKAAVRFVRANALLYDLDPERIAVLGGSSGGHLAALLGTSGGVTRYTVGNAEMDIEGTLGSYLGTSSLVQAVCEVAGPTDFLRLNECYWTSDHTAPDSFASRLIGGPVLEHPDECALADPMTYIGPGDPPFAIFHGSEDGVVPWCQSQYLDDALRAAGVPSTFTLVEGAGHALQGSQAAVDAAVAFLKQVLRPERQDVWDAFRADTVSTTPSKPKDLTVVGDLLFFTAYDDTHGRELWKSDGSMGGAHLVRDITPRVSIVGPKELTAVGDRLFFTASDRRGMELWVSDGTQAGTHIVEDINPNAPSSSPSNLVAMNGLLFFSADDGVNGRELWKSNGTQTGTKIVKNIRTSAGVGAAPDHLCVVGDEVFFSATGNAGGCELWASDGDGARRVKDIRPGASGSSPTELVAANRVLYFSADDGVNGRELWTSDGTPEGTHYVKDISVGSGSFNPADLTAVGSTVFFHAGGQDRGGELWVSDGTKGWTHLVKDVASVGGVAPRQLTALGGRLFFIADAAGGDALWASDGTDGGTHVLGSTGLEYPANREAAYRFAVADGALFFASCDASGKYGVSKTDGTEVGTVKLADTPTGPGGAELSWLAAAGGKAFFVLNRGAQGTELWAIAKRADESPSNRVAAFYYPWYGTPSVDGRWDHWNEVGFNPPQDISSDYYPFLGAYSSVDPAVVARHFAWLRDAGVGVIVSSWWGQGSDEDDAVPVLLDVAEEYGIQVAFHIEPYAGRTAQSLVKDVKYLYARCGDHPAFFRTTGSSRWSPNDKEKGLFFVWRIRFQDGASTVPVEPEYWRAAVDKIHNLPDGGLIMADTTQTDWVDRGHFDGLYNYATLAQGADVDFSWGQALPPNAWYVPCVIPGFSSQRIGDDPSTYVPRSDGATYDEQWTAALGVRVEPAMVGITSFNEWHEGTQIEPAARDRSNGAGYEYASYDPLAPDAYLTRTHTWVDTFLCATWPEPHRVRVRLSTTSDWTTLSLVDGATAVQQELVSASPAPTRAEVSSGGLRLIQPIVGGPETYPPAEMTVDMGLVDVDPAGSVVFEIERGYIGCTTVEVMSFTLDGEPHVVLSETWCGIEEGEHNTHRFEVPVSLLTGGAP